MDVGAYLMSTSVVKYLLQYLNGKKIPESARPVGKVVQLNVYPVKSMKGIQVEEVVCTKTGVRHNALHDRGWMVVTESYNAVSGRNSPKIAKIKTSFHGDEIHIEADGLSVLKLPVKPHCTNLKVVWIRSFGQYMQGLDFGEDAADWITKFFQNSQKYRIVCCPLSGENRYGCTKSKVLRLWTDPIDPKQVTFQDGYNCSLASEVSLADLSDKAQKSIPMNNFRANIIIDGIEPYDEVTFQDGYNCSLASEVSLADLSDKAQKSIPMNNFRANIIIDGIEPYDEDGWEEIYIGETKFTNTFLGIRCSFTTVDQDTGTRDSDGEPLRTLKRHWIATTDDYDSLGGRNEPKIATIRTSLHGDEFWLEADGCTPLKFPVNPNCSKLRSVWVRFLGQLMFGFDLGEEASAWITRFLQRSVKHRIVYCPSGKENRYFRKGTTDKLMNKWAEHTEFEQIGYQDGCNCTMISEASLADLNERLETPVSMDNFRPNIIVDGCKPYAEDKWQELFIRDTRFTVKDWTIRCHFTTVNRETGIRHPKNEPLKTLKTYRMLSPMSFFETWPVFGVYLSMIKPGTIQVGDDVYATEEEKNDF